MRRFMAIKWVGGGGDVCGEGGGQRPAAVNVTARQQYAAILLANTALLSRNHFVHSTVDDDDDVELNVLECRGDIHY